MPTTKLILPSMVAKKALRQKRALFPMRERPPVSYFSVGVQ